MEEDDDDDDDDDEDDDDEDGVEKDLRVDAIARLMRSLERDSSSPSTMGIVITCTPFLEPQPPSSSCTVAEDGVGRPEPDPDEDDELLLPLLLLPLLLLLLLA